MLLMASTRAAPWRGLVDTHAQPVQWLLFFVWREARLVFLALTELDDMRTQGVMVIRPSESKSVQCSAHYVVFKH